MRVGTHGARSVRRAAYGLVLLSAALFVPAAAASAQEAQPASEPDSRLLLYVGLAVLTVGTVLVVGIRLRYLARRGRNGASSRVPKRDALVPASAASLTLPPPNGTPLVPPAPDLSLSDLSLPEPNPQRVGNGSGGLPESLDVAFDSEPGYDLSTAAVEQSNKSASVVPPRRPFDDKMQEFLRELRSYHK